MREWIERIHELWEVGWNKVRRHEDIACPWSALVP